MGNSPRPRRHKSVDYKKKLIFLTFFDNFSKIDDIYIYMEDKDKEITIEDFIEAFEDFLNDID